MYPASVKSQEHKNPYNWRDRGYNLQEYAVYWVQYCPQKAPKLNHRIFVRRREVCSILRHVWSNPCFSLGLRSSMQQFAIIYNHLRVLVFATVCHPVLSDATRNKRIKSDATSVCIIIICIVYCSPSDEICKFVFYEIKHAKHSDVFSLKCSFWTGVNACKSCRSRDTLKNAYLIPTIVFCRGRSRQWPYVQRIDRK